MVTAGGLQTIPSGHVQMELYILQVKTSKINRFTTAVDLRPKSTDSQPYSSGSVVTAGHRSWLLGLRWTSLKPITISEILPNKTRTCREKKEKITKAT